MPFLRATCDVGPAGFLLYMLPPFCRMTIDDGERGWAPGFLEFLLMSSGTTLVIASVYSMTV